MTTREHRAPAQGTEQAEPTFSEMLSQQLGGWRGMVESSIPVMVFVIVNIVSSLTPALIASVAVALAIAVYRLARRESVQHAVNGLVGIGLGAVIAWKTGQAKDFYLPGILMVFLYGLLLVGSVFVRKPVIGYLWAVIAAGGQHAWREQPRLMRAFQWLTLLWAAQFFVKGLVQGGLYLADEEDLLGIARLAMGWPLLVAMVAITVWSVRRATHAPSRA